MDIKLETLRYHLVIFWKDFFTIDFHCKSGPFVIQNRYTSFSVKIEIGALDAFVFKTPKYGVLNNTQTVF